MVGSVGSHTILYEITRSYLWFYHFYDSRLILNVLVRWDHKIVRSYDPDRNFDNHSLCKHWVPLASPWYKANTDATIFTATNFVGIGVVIHEAPATAPWSYWSWIESNGWSRTFCLGYQDPRCYLWRWFMHHLSCSLGFGLSWTLLSTSGSLLQEFRSFQVLHVQRLGNKLAHILAKYAKGIDSFVTWIEKNPSIIESLVIQDVMYFSSSK